MLMRLDRAKREAKKNAENMYDQHYGSQDNYNPSYGAPDRLQQEYGNRW